jgi:hypothetical protein
MEVSIGADQATAAPAPIRLSTVRRECRSGRSSWLSGIVMSLTESVSWVRRSRVVPWPYVFWPKHAEIPTASPYYVIWRRHRGDKSVNSAP